MIRYADWLGRLMSQKIILTRKYFQQYQHTYYSYQKAYQMCTTTMLEWSNQNEDSILLVQYLVLTFSQLRHDCL